MLNIIIIIITNKLGIPDSVIVTLSNSHLTYDDVLTSLKHVRSL